jgi:hypothetical protein
MMVSITSRHEQATLANVNRIGIVGMLCADDLVSFVSRSVSVDFSAAANRGRRLDAAERQAVEQKMRDEGRL